MLHAYLFFRKFSYLHGLIRVFTLIFFRVKFLPTLHKREGKIIFYLVPIRLLGPACLLNSKKLFCHLTCLFGSHANQAAKSTEIIDPKSLFYKTVIYFLNLLKCTTFFSGEIVVGVFLAFWPCSPHFQEMPSHFCFDHLNFAPCVVQTATQLCYKVTLALLPFC